MFVSDNYILSGYVSMADTYISIISTVCATGEPHSHSGFRMALISPSPVWASSFAFREDRHPNEECSPISPGWSAVQISPRTHGFHGSGALQTQGTLSTEKFEASHVSSSSTNFEADDRSMKSDVESQWHETHYSAGAPIPLVPLRRHESS